MTVSFVADDDLYEPVKAALEKLHFDIIRAPARDDKNLLAKTLELGKVLITRDTGIPSQAYAFEFAKNGLSVVVLRWKGSNATVWQEMTLAILRYSKEWECIANTEPSVISVKKNGYRARAWKNIPEAIGNLHAVT